MTTGLRPSSLPVARTYDFADPESDNADICWYATVVKNLSSLAPSQQSTLTIDRGVDFYWIATTMQGDITSGGANTQTESSIVVPMINVRVTDDNSDKSLQNLQFPVGSIAGCGERPWLDVAPRIIPGASILLFAWNAIVASGVTYNNLFLVLHGFTRPSQWPS